ncbi:capsular biosynthesis protein, partial [Roseovarius sp. HI0049]
MPPDNDGKPAGHARDRRVFYFNAGFFRQRRTRRIMELAGYPLRLGKPSADDLIAVWGHSPYAGRGEKVAEATGAGLLRVEDIFLRSLFPGRSGEPPLGLAIDTQGVHFNPNTPTDLETLLATHPLDDTVLMDRARGAIARIHAAHLTKYTGFDVETPAPDPGYVLVIDQTKDDASVTHGNADANTFREMLYYAQEENPGARILVKTHPETQHAHRDGYFSGADENERVRLHSNPVSPWSLLDGAIAVYTVSSQLGFEAIFAGHRPRVFGQPFYAGWGLTDDRHPRPLPRRGRRLSKAQIFAATMILYPHWYDPYRDRLGTLEDALSALEAQTRAWREDRRGWAAYAMRLWKRKPLQRFFGRHEAVRFAADNLPAGPRPAMVWASKPEVAPEGAVRVEDGFLRSRGLGADLIPPLSLVCDDLGIYYDPAKESRLERLVAARAELRPDQQARAEALIRTLTRQQLSKYNLGEATPALPSGHL